MKIDKHWAKFVEKYRDNFNPDIQKVYVGEFFIGDRKFRIKLNYNEEVKYDNRF